MMLLAGVSLILYGLSLRSEVVTVEPKGRLWVEGEDYVPPEGKRLTWGVAVRPEEAPAYWRFHVVFRANASAWVKAYWDDPSRAMYEESGSSIDDVVLVKISDMDHHREWTWYIDNTGKHTVSVENFTVVYEGVVKPKETLGGRVAYSGGAVAALSAAALTLLKARGRRFA